MFEDSEGSGGVIVWDVDWKIKESKIDALKLKDFYVITWRMKLMKLTMNQEVLQLNECLINCEFSPGSSELLRPALSVWFKIRSALGIKLVSCFYSGSGVSRGMEDVDRPDLWNSTRTI
ncbi:hypothetical protein NPIL_13781 [Nephila pilipes]|uniref:Uncharacterized protein n=1 Tax=Nephila pilipes TaxID=299642 RepID=A0A8X6SYA2_NEPPI|nr:hypothetical protein NPIL_13781 [Nephila pilipes]